MGKIFGGWVHVQTGYKPGLIIFLIENQGWFQHFDFRGGKIPKSQ